MHMQKTQPEKPGIIYSLAAQFHVEWLFSKLIFRNKRTPHLQTNIPPPPQPVIRSHRKARRSRELRQMRKKYFVLFFIYISNKRKAAFKYAQTPKKTKTLTLSCLPSTTKQMWHPHSHIHKTYLLYLQAYKRTQKLLHTHTHKHNLSMRAPSHTRGVGGRLSCL